MPSEPSVNEILDEVARRVDDRIPKHLAVDESLFAYLRLMLDEAGNHVHVGEEIPEGARARPIRKVLVDGLRPITSYQRVFNTRVLEALEILNGLARAQTAETDSLEPRLNRMNASIATIDVAIDQVADRLRELETRIAALETSTEGSEPIDPLGRRVDLQTILNRIQLQEAKINRLRRAQGAAEEHPDPDSTGDVARPDATGAMQQMDVEFDHDDARLYADLEEVFRGSRAAVRALMEPYVADITAIDSQAPVVDIGCGRGEWLEILRDNAVPSYGYDLNPLTVADCVERGLDVHCGDAIAHLRGLPEASVRAVTGFHIAEHLPLDTLLELLESALVALVPGGALILETPNCTNLSVGASSFHLDPTHVKPLHPQLLEFLCRQRGFDTVEVRYLHPRKPPVDERALALQRSTLPPGMLDEINWALFGPMDYAAIASKAP